MFNPTVVCTVVSSDTPPLAACGRLPFDDLMPWADPYIAALVDKVQRSGWPLLTSSQAAQYAPDDLYFGEETLGDADLRKNRTGAEQGGDSL